jgi:hypothetical protein
MITLNLRKVKKAKSVQHTQSVHLPNKNIKEIKETRLNVFIKR